MSGGPTAFAGPIERLAEAFGRTLTTHDTDALVRYVELVERWNAKVNLTAARGAEGLCEVLLGDAFVLADVALVPEGARVLDVGSGAGAPIVPLLLLRPDLRALCLEPLGKRATFLRTVSARLALAPRMRVFERRLELDRPPAEQLAELGVFDVACSRATFGPERWLQIGIALAPRVLVLTASREPLPAPAGAHELLARDYALPFSQAARRVAVYLRG